MYNSCTFEIPADKATNARKQSNSSSFLYQGKRVQKARAPETAQTHKRRAPTTQKPAEREAVESTLTAEQDETETG